MLRQSDLAGSGCELLFFFHPFLKTAFQDAPLAADFERGNLPMLDHAMQRPLGNFQYDGGFGQSQKSNGAIELFHKFGAPGLKRNEQAICQELLGRQSFDSGEL